MDEWGARMNLTAIRDREQQLTKHVLDSLSVGPWLRGERVADLGSGAGFPGIPLSIVEPARHFALIESTGKKCDFLRHVAGELGLANIEIVQARAEAYRPPLRFGTVVARAVGPIADLVRRGGHLVTGGGRLLAMKGRLPEEELGARLSGWKLAGVHRLAVPGLLRSAISSSSATPTRKPEKWPRKHTRTPGPVKQLVTGVFSRGFAAILRLP